MSNNLQPSTSAGGFSTVGNVTANNFVTVGTSGNITGANVISANTLSATGAANLYSVNMNQSITWPGASQIYEDTVIAIQGNAGVYITSPNDTQINANTSSWTFANTGVLTLPGEGVIYSNNDTINLKSLDTPNGIAYGARIGTSGGLYLEQGSNPAYLTFDSNAGNAQIYAASGLSGNAGKNLTIYAGSADEINYNTSPGGNIYLQAGAGGSNDGGGGGQGGGINITAGNSLDPFGIPGNITVNTGNYTWNFNYNGDLRLPEGTAYISSAANALNLHAGGNESIYMSSASDGISVETNSNVAIISNVDGATNYAWTFDNTGNLTLPGSAKLAGNAFTAASGNTAYVSDNSLNNYIYASAGGVGMVTGSGVGSLTFDPDGNITSTANILNTGFISTSGNVSTGGFFIGDGSLLSNLPAGSYSNTNVAAYLSSGTVSTDYLTTAVVCAQGNVRGGNINTAGLVTATGNVYGANFIGNGGTLSNVSLSTGSVVDSPGNVQLGNLVARIAGTGAAAYPQVTVNKVGNSTLIWGGTMTDWSNASIGNSVIGVGNGGTTVVPGTWANVATPASGSNLALPNLGDTCSITVTDFDPTNSQSWNVTFQRVAGGKQSILITKIA